MSRPILRRTPIRLRRPTRNGISPLPRLLAAASALLGIAGLIGGSLLIAGPAGAASIPDTRSVKIGTQFMHVSTAATAAASTRPGLGLYTHPGAKGLAETTVFESAIGRPVDRVLDFLPETTWQEMTRVDWLLAPHGQDRRTLEISVPMLPRTSGTSLVGCAGGDYNQYWRSIAESLVRTGNADSTVRPGWEMNGAWYPWNAAGREQAYIGCYRQLVTTMRAVAGQRFSFSWTVNLGYGTLAAETVWPGAQYVDVIGVDAYDTSWTWNPTPPGVTTTQAARNSWAWIARGDHGLQFWSAFAKTQNRPLALPEWGATWRSDGRGGNDNPIFMDGMLDFIADPANNVAYATYFNNDDSATAKHNLTAPGSYFPTAAACFTARKGTLSGEC